jgi:hypothetical protein
MTSRTPNAVEIGNWLLHLDVLYCRCARHRATTFDTEQPLRILTMELTSLCWHQEFCGGSENYFFFWGGGVDNLCIPVLLSRTTGLESFKSSLSYTKMKLPFQITLQPSIARNHKP